MVHIVDDEEVILDATSMLLDSVGITNTTYSSAEQFLQAFGRTSFNRQSGCIILDIRMPIVSGIECQQNLVSQGCKLPIIFVTGHGDIPMAVEAMKKGACEFIQKPFREQELLDAVHKALQLNRVEQQQLLKHKEIQNNILSLSKRERQVLDKIVEGKANKVIAIDLHLSQRTVEIHRASVMDKMAADSLAHLVKMVLQITQT